MDTNLIRCNESLYLLTVIALSVVYAIPTSDPITSSTGIDHPD